MPQSPERITGRVAEVGSGNSGPSLFIWVEDRLLPARISGELHTPLFQHDLVRCTTDEDGTLVVEELERTDNCFFEDILRWRRPDCTGRTRIHYLKMRERIRKAAEAYFGEEGFTSIPSPVLVKNPNPEPQFDIVATESGCLITSPELQLKRLLTGGFEKIYSLVPCFRGKETDRTHNPEFTMLEWYRTGCGLESMRRDLRALILRTAESCGALNDEGRLRGTGVRMNGDWAVQTVQELVLERLGLDLQGCAAAPLLYTRGEKLGLFTREHRDERFEQLFSRLWSRFESSLGRDRPLFITEWPLPLASLAAPSVTDPTVSLRMELVINGIEVANGFRELTDPGEQEKRMLRDSRLRQDLGLSTYSPDRVFLESIRAGLPESAGMALGFERLCMLLLEAPDIRSVLPFTAEEL